MQNPTFSREVKQNESRVTIVKRLAPWRCIWEYLTVFLPIPFFSPHLSVRTLLEWLLLPHHFDPRKLLTCVAGMGFTSISEDSSEISFLLVENYNYDHSLWSSDRMGIFGKFICL